MNDAQRDAYEERAAIMEYDGELPRAEAERQAREWVLSLCGFCLGGHNQQLGRCSAAGCRCCGAGK